jgi:hypothetical protein
MVKREIVTLLASAALIVFATGCATERTNDAVASLTQSDVSRSFVPRELVGTWSGWFRPVGGADGGGGNATDGAVTLEIKDDGTYQLVETGRGRGDMAGRKTNDSGVVVANGRGITLKSSSGPWTSLRRNGNALYGVTHHSSGRAIQITVERAVP